MGGHVLRSHSLKGLALVIIDIGPHGADFGEVTFAAASVEPGHADELLAAEIPGHRHVARRRDLLVPSGLAIPVLFVEGTGHPTAGAGRMQEPQVLLTRGDKGRRDPFELG
jgi:hypothetical protein